MKKRMFSIMDTTNKRKGSIVLCAITIVVLISGSLVACNGTNSNEETQTPTTSTDITAETPEASTAPTEGEQTSTDSIAETPEASTAQTGGEQNTAEKYTSFINSQEGVAFKEVTDSAVKAYLSGDLDELSNYLSDTYTVTAKLDLYKDIDKIEFLFSDDYIRTDTEISANYLYLIDGDSNSYVTMDLVKIDNEWKINFIGNEK